MKKTEQMEFWKGEFGDEYTERNTGNFDKLYESFYGVTRTALNKKFLGRLAKDLRILEVGCNKAVQLQLLKRLGFSDLWGIEINRKALMEARADVTFNLVEASAFDIPFKDGFFDMVFTSGVLIHIAPKDLPKAIDEIYRTSKKYIWSYEYFSEKNVALEYRGHKNRLWKSNFMQLFLDRHPDLRLVKKELLKRSDGDADIMFLLEK